MYICEALVVICGMPYGVAQNGIIIMQMFLPTLETKKSISWPNTEQTW